MPQNLDDVIVAVAANASAMPEPAEVEQLYGAAAALPPLNESPEVATMFAGLYQQVRGAPDTIVVTARRQGQLVGFAYGHPWSWMTATDNWSQQLRGRLRDDADLLDNSFAVELLVVAPSVAGNGLGGWLLSTLLTQDDHAVSWLQTTDLDTPARRLYQHTGWIPLGHGPDAPNGRPGLVMIHRAR